MSKVRIAQDGRHFEKAGKQFFLMADTCWSAFTNMTTEEWEKYLQIRASQGYNAVQINILPQWDRGIAPGESMCPFLNPGQKELSLSDIPEAYFDHIEEFLKKANEYNITPILVLLWSNYTNGTFFNVLWGHLPVLVEDVTNYVCMAAQRFKEYDPMYFVSGDTMFSDTVVDQYYLPALIALKDADPSALASLHICGDGFLTPEEIENSIPARLLYNDRLDFYTYQSGHFNRWLERCEDCAKAFRHLKVTKPVFNAEPCYEGWDTDNTAHDADHLRQSTWLSILFGADAGLTYGAQGVWQWFRKGDFFAPYDVKDAKLLYVCEQPFTAWEAMAFDGALDRSFAKTLMEKHEIIGVEPDSRVEAETSLTRLAIANGGAAVLLYMPRNQKTRVGIPSGNMDFTLYDLKQRKEIAAPVVLTEDSFIVDYPGVNSDMLLIGCAK